MNMYNPPPPAIQATWLWFLPWSGRNTARASLGFGGVSMDFPIGLSPTPIAHVSTSPPLIPDGRIYRVRLAATVFPENPSYNVPRLKSLPTYTPWSLYLIFSSTFYFRIIPSYDGCRNFNDHYLPRAPLPLRSVTSTGVTLIMTSIGITQSL